MRDAGKAASPGPPSDGPLWRVARHLGVYSVGSAISLISSFAILPIYATQFSARQFGVVATGQVASLAAITVARLGLTSGLFRFLAVYHTDADQASSNQAVTTGVSAATASSLVVTLVMLGGWAWLGRQTSPDIQLSGYLIGANVVLSAPRECAEFVLRARQQSRAYVLLTSTTTVTTTVLTAGLAVIFHLGAVAVFASALAANTAMSAAALIVIRTDLKISSWSLAELRRQLRFGLPGVPALLADWVMQFSDRIFLTRFAGLTQVGVYSLGYRIGLIEQQILGTATSAAWDPFVLSEYRAEGGLRTIGRVNTYFAIVGIALVLFISASAPPFLWIVHARSEYLASTSVVMLIALANFFATMQHMLAAPANLKLRPELGTMFRGIGAVVNVALNFALIPSFGMMGAAWSTLATFVVTATVTDVVCRRVWPIPYEYRKLALIIAGGVLILILIQLSQSAGSLVFIATSPAWSLLLYGGWIMGTRTFSVDELRSLARRLRRVASGAGLVETPC